MLRLTLAKKYCFLLFNLFLLLFMGFVHYTTKAWENAYMVGSGPYTWNGCEQRKRKSWLKDPILGPCQRRDCIGKKVRYAPDLVLKHS